jgi:DNA-binding Lrp family transcriptional regulator
VAFDELDKRIVAALVDDGRATYAEVGARVGLSAPAVKRRVDRLRAAGAVTGFSAQVNPSKLGWTTEAYVELFCRGRTSPADIAAAVSKHPEVTEACTITGDADARSCTSGRRTCTISSRWWSGSGLSSSWCARAA